MKSRIWVFMLISLFLAYFISANIFPGETWESARLDLGNGGDQIFYILFKARNGNKNAPLILYMAGGPGTSGEFNLFLENGPYVATPKETIERNEYAWNNKFDVIFVDQPVGVGFSKARDFNTSCRDLACYAGDMYIFLKEFCKKNPQYKGRPLYISGVSYAGHYVPGLSAYLMKKNDTDINFRGAIIGGPWVDAETQFTLDPLYLYANAIFSFWEYIYYRSGAVICRILMKFNTAYEYDVCSEWNDYKDNATNIINQMNIAEKRTYREENRAVYAIMNDNETQKELGVCCTLWTGKNKTAGALLRKYDWIIPYQDQIEYILDHGKPVTLMYGNFDYTCQYLGGLAMAEKIKWSGLKEFLKKEWEDVILDGKVYGKTRIVKNFEFLLVYNAGHLIPKNQPLFALHAVEQFIENNP